MNLVYISGSPRKDGNTDQLLNQIKNQTGGVFFRICDYSIEPCKSCWGCRETGTCVIQDDMSNVIIPKLLVADGLILGSPVYFNNVSAQLKAFIDRTWSIKGKLRNKIGASIVVCRKYGAEGAITAINSFFLKHEMLVANRGITGIAFKKSEVKLDEESYQSAEALGLRLLELFNLQKKMTY